jgi:hypothetical protein
MSKKYLYPLSRLEARPGANQDKHANIIDPNRVIRRDGFRCKICMIPRFPTLDHIIPEILGGSNRQDNC